jgi:hypothetical protein
MYSPKVGMGTAMRSIRVRSISEMSSVAPLPMMSRSGSTLSTAARLRWLMSGLLDG